MHTPKSHDENNSRDLIECVLKEVFIFLKNAFQNLSILEIEKKKALSLTIIIMTLTYFLGSRGIPILDHVLSLTSDYWDNSGNYKVNYTVFLIIWSPAIYFLSLYWNTKTLKFRLSVAYVIGLLTYRVNNIAWELYDFRNFMSCLEISGLFVCITAILIYFVREVKE